MVQVVLDIPDAAYQLLSNHLAPWSVDQALRLVVVALVAWPFTHGSSRSALTTRQRTRKTIDNPFGEFTVPFCNGAKPDGVYAEERIHVQAERKFKDAVAEITQGFKTEHLQWLAENDIPLSAVLRECGYDTKPPENLRPVAQCLLELPDHRILELIREAAPDHGEVLDQYPKFAATVIKAFRELVVTR